MIPFNPLDLIGPQWHLVYPTKPRLGTMIIAAPDGTAGGDGTERSPVNLYTAVSQATAGTLVYLRGGTYRWGEGNGGHLNFSGTGTAVAPITFESYPGEWAVINGDHMARQYDAQILISGDFNQLRRLEIAWAPIHSSLAVWGDNNLVEGVYLHNGYGTGINNTQNASNNTYRHCAVVDVTDTTAGGGGGNADGIQISQGTGAIVQNCSVDGSSDDGFDAWDSSGGVFINCIAQNCGHRSGDGGGFKLGGATGSNNKAINCIAANNNGAGFNNNTASGGEYINCTSYNNGDYAFKNTESDSVIHRCVSFLDLNGNVHGSATETECSWQQTAPVDLISGDNRSPDFLQLQPTTYMTTIGAHMPAPATRSA